MPSWSSSFRGSISRELWPLTEVVVWRTSKDQQHGRLRWVCGLGGESEKGGGCRASRWRRRRRGKLDVG